jgi:KDO2-lipid IV(A) lauroyltransferase
MKHIRYLFEAILLGFFLLLSKCLPVAWASGLGGWIGRNIGSRLAASRKAYRNLQMTMPHLSHMEQKQIIMGMWDNLGRVMLEYPHLNHIAANKTEIIGAELFDTLKGKAAIFISAHTANWECCPPAIYLQTGYQSSSIYRPPNNPYSDWLLKRARSLRGKLSTIPKSKSGTRNIVAALKNNQGIGILIDQKYNRGIKIDFIDKPAMTSPIFAQLAQKFDCPLVPLKIERIKGANFRITVCDPIETKNRIAEDIVAESHDILEDWIKEKPAQWLWLHRRWMSDKELNKYTSENKD